MLIFVNYWNRGGLGGGRLKILFFFFFLCEGIKEND